MEQSRRSVTRMIEARPWRRYLWLVPASLAVLVSGCGPYIRHDISTLSPTAVASLRKGFAVMEARSSDPTDPTSLAYQAGIHGSYASPMAGWNQCQHGSYFFFSWHRMYLYYFERILRAASGDYGLTLPYWNYSKNATAGLPSIFTTPADAATNSLFVSQRNSAMNMGGTLPPSATDYSNAYSYTNFSAPNGSSAGFGGQQVPAPGHFLGPHGALEAQPHDIVHVLVGGWMGDPNTAAQDPIFWLHHANIDRLWSHWNDDIGGSDPSDTVWLNTAFTFYDENKKPVTLTGAQVVNTVSQLGYKYDDEIGRYRIKDTEVCCAHVHPQDPVIATSQPAQKAALSEKPLEMKVPFVRNGASRMREALAIPEGRLTLRIDGIDYEPPQTDYWEVYVNPPPGNLEYKDPSYVGSLALFALKPHHGMAEGGEKPVAAFDLSRVVRRLQEMGRWNDKEMTVRFVRRGVIPPPGVKEEVRTGVRGTFERISIVLE